MSAEQISKNGYEHFMLKEIFEQENVIKAIMANKIEQQKLLNDVFAKADKDFVKNIQQIKIIACGTSYHAGLIAKYWLEKLARVQCMVEIASEYRFREAVVSPNTLAITISQSGETADTVDALRKAKTEGYAGTLAICNVKDTTLERESDFVIHTEAGVEIGIASTKVFLTQLIALLFIALHLAKEKKTLSTEEVQSHLDALQDLPNKISQVLQLAPAIQDLAQHIKDRNNTVFVGRNILYPVALEGALKLKETSYIQAEAYPAGEFRHGPIALVDETFPVIAVVANNTLLENMKNNIAEIQSRGGKVIVFAEEGIEFSNTEGLYCVHLPKVADVLEPMSYAVPLQLFAYYVALARGNNVDEPRNLTKSVSEYPF